MKFIVIAVLLVPALVNAQVIITEVMYDLQSGSDSGREWVEVYNSGSAPVPLTEWKLFENGSNHKITALGVTSLPAATHAVIADNAEKFKADWPAFSGLLFDSAFSLNNDGETIALRTGAGADIDAVTYTSAMGAKGTGDSLQLENSSWAFGMPTPAAGIPAGGLVPSPTKTTKKPTTQAAAAAAAPEIRGEAAQRAKSDVLVASAAGASSLWWAGPILLAVFGGAGIVWSRYLRRDEWEIEEMPNTG